MSIVRRGRKISNWVLATRPWAFSASVVPVLAVAGHLGWRGALGDVTNIALSLVVIVLLHAGTDVLSDCKDHESGVDYTGSPNGVTWLHSGLFSVKELRTFALSLLALGAGLGLVVAARSAWNVLWIGAAGGLIALGYSLLKYHALGDVAVFLAFSLLPALGVGFVSTGHYAVEPVLVALPPGLLTLAILNANNIRDVRTDAAAGCRTFPLVCGLRVARAVYVGETVLPYALVAAFLTVGLVPYAAIGTFLTLPLAVRNLAALRRGEMATLDRASAQLQLLFGLLFALAFPLGCLGFWWQLGFGSVVTGALAFRFLPSQKPVCWTGEIGLGLLLAAALWGVFWIGDVVSQQLFGFARAQVDAVYALRANASPLAVGLALAFLIGPAEELFWRGLVQRTLMTRLGANAGFALATLAYALVHVWSLNFMLVAAAGVCGLFWGALYRFFPQRLWALVISHAAWDVAVFVLFPIGVG